MIALRQSEQALQSQVNILRKRLKKANQFNPYPWLVLMGIVALG
jgi:uncharacterized protein involved in exopolysaccharide biosynthesis